MFERFTERARKVLVPAQEEAIRLRHGYIGPEYILLGLVRESEGVAARALLNLDVDPDEIRRGVIRRLPGEEPGFGEDGRGRVPFRGREDGERAELNLPRPVAVTAGAGYAYLAPAKSADGTATVEPGDVADEVRAGLGEAGLPAFEASVAAVGGRLLDAFPAMMEVSVTVSGVPGPSDPPAPCFSVSATFHR